MPVASRENQPESGASRTDGPGPPGCEQARTTSRQPTQALRSANTHDPIITRATFEAAQKILAGWDKSGTFRHKLLGRGRTSNFLLAGLITCEACGHRFSGWSQKWKRKVKPPPAERHQVYLCGGYLHKGNAVCRRVAIDKQPFEAFIVEQVRFKLMGILEGGAMERLRTYVREELSQALAHPKEELARVEDERARLLASLTPVNADRGVF